MRDIGFQPVVERDGKGFFAVDLEITSFEWTKARWKAWLTIDCKGFTPLGCAGENEFGEAIFRRDKRKFYNGSSLICASACHTSACSCAQSQ